MSYAEDIFLDHHNLDKEWIKQSSLYFKYASLHADAIAKRDSLKEELEVVKAELFVRIQKGWAEYGFEKKPTDGVAKAFVDQAEEVAEIAEEIIEANKEVNILASAKVAFEHKKKALENLTTLWVQNWHAEPKEGVFNKGYETELFQRKQTRELKSNKRLQNLKKKKEDKNG
jgi:transposase-like protein